MEWIIGLLSIVVTILQTWRLRRAKRALRARPSWGQPDPMPKAAWARGMARQQDRLLAETASLKEENARLRARIAELETSADLALYGRSVAGSTQAAKAQLHTAELREKGASADWSLL